ncbi:MULTISPECIES: hypothetical protein [Carboxydocella]|uniref:Diheme cytochrome c NapB n=2 Tax=Carboxydocella TaxID=178898 RepID=A0A1T4R154_9FIRM|nr:MULTISPECIES: hypothetical protein [Carboxydocella]AVX19800.1 hypothetical protein CFE_0601 [Carboxydocella thermautotrophica]AVX30209.1 hypothetical protein CTH_0606 [Carboxydocella thermautotrophica]SKA09328.1 hypothetical protein SAMN02745885_01874 [Carboxydocella sporoproducens DSM 16521]GAW28605.1 hypothetical protein ULO1_11750 [Carboxydocella sp. ULO1]GAW30694.1 hypothetical protein JDF658_04590 [Carboxydocella sp. JDF658]
MASNKYLLPMIFTILVTILFGATFALSWEPFIAGPPPAKVNPPTIPHTLQGREGKCILCHKDAAGVKIPRTPHPDRANCLQCHVPN